MANLELLGFESLEDALRRISDIPDDIIKKALVEMSEVARKEIKNVGESMDVRDEDNQGTHILDNIVVAKEKLTEDGGYKDVTFRGSRTRGRTSTRNAAIAFINEFGKTNQPARPFVGQAMNQSADKITAPAEKIIGDWIEQEYSKN